MTAKITDTLNNFFKSNRHRTRSASSPSCDSAKEFIRKSSPKIIVPGTPPNTDDEEGEDADPVLACGIMPNSLVSLFRRPGRSCSVDSGDSRSRTFSMKHVSIDLNEKFRNILSTDHSLSVPHGQRSPRQDSKVRNIYRKPVSRSGHRYGADSYSRSPTGGFDHIDYMNHSTPHLSDQYMSSQMYRSTQIIPNGKYEDVERSDTKRPTDLFAHAVVTDLSDFRPRACSMPAIPQSILRKRHPPTAVPSISQNRSPTTKHACFKNEVDVYYFNSSETLQNPSDISDSEPLRIQAPPADNTEIIHINPDFGVTVEGGYRTNNTSICDGSSSEFVCNVVTKTIPSIDAYGRHGRRLRLTLTTLDCYRKDKTTVKSMSGGGAVVVKFVPLQSRDDDRTAQQEYIKKITLPFKIDPYQVRAKMESTNSLSIEAPVVI